MKSRGPTGAVAFARVYSSWMPGASAPARSAGCSGGGALLTNNDSFRRRHWGLERLVVGVRNADRVCANVLGVVNTQYWRRNVEGRALTVTIVLVLQNAYDPMRCIAVHESQKSLFTSSRLMLWSTRGFLPI